MDNGNIYKIINNKNNEIYIGCTIYPINKRFEEHIYRCFKTNYKSKLYNSIRKYGVENFSIELIEVCNLKEIYDKEREYIKKYDSFKNGLNTTLGGEGCLGYIHSNEIRKKISRQLKKGNSHKNKTYDQLYGDKSDREKIKRKNTVKKYWENITENEKKLRIEKLKTKVRDNSKYSLELIKEVKEKLKIKKVKEVSEEYPQIKISYLYTIKSNKRWKDI